MSDGYDGNSKGCGDDGGDGSGIMIMVIMMTSRKISPMLRWRLSTTEESSEEPTLQRPLPLELMGWTILEILLFIAFIVI